MPMKIEAWPGGRWFRDLGDNNGHFWGHVQAIKRPTLLEITGPLFMSYAVVSNLQYRLSEVGWRHADQVSSQGDGRRSRKTIGKGSVQVGRHAAGARPRAGRSRFAVRSGICVRHVWQLHYGS